MKKSLSPFIKQFANDNTFTLEHGGVDLEVTKCSPGWYVVKTGSIEMKVHGLANIEKLSDLIEESIDAGCKATDKMWLESQLPELEKKHQEELEELKQAYQAKLKEIYQIALQEGYEKGFEEGAKKGAKEVVNYLQEQAQEQELEVDEQEIDEQEAEKIEKLEKLVKQINEIKDPIEKQKAVEEYRRRLSEIQQVNNQRKALTIT